MREQAEQYKQDFYLDWSATSEIRDQANEEFRFVTVPGGQWEGWLESAYENRAKLELNHVSEHLYRNYAQWCQNRSQPNYQAADDETNDDLADLMDMLYRRDAQRLGGQDAIDTAVWEAMSCGYGAVVLNTQYEDEGDPENDNQNIIISSQPNAYSTVVFDSGARTIDKSDARHCTILTPYSKRLFEEMYPEANSADLMMQDRSFFNWRNGDLIYVGTRYEISKEKIFLQTWVNSKSQEIIRVKRAEAEENIDELKFAGFDFARERAVVKRCAYTSKFTADQILEKPKKIVGEHIPVVPFYGHRSIVDGSEYYHGLARQRMDAQRVTNMSYSLAAESAAHASDSKPIFAPEQMTNPTVRNQWAGNWHQKPYLLADALRDQQGNPVSVGPVATLPGTSISPAVAQLVEMSTESLQRAMGGAPQDTLDPEASGKAINAIIKRVDLNTAPVHDNIRKGIHRIGVVYESMAREVYSAQRNRSLKVVTERGESQSVTLNTVAYQDGAILPVNDLSKGKYEVVVDTSADYQTAKEETFEALKDVLTIMPQEDPLRGVLAQQLILLKDAKGLEDIQDYIRRMQVLGGYIPAETDEEKQMLANAQKAAANQPKDPNAAYLESLAAEQQAQAALNQAKIAETAASAVKKSAEAEETKVDVALKKQQVMRGFAEAAQITQAQR